MRNKRKIEMIDVQQLSFFCFPMISVLCTGSGYFLRNAKFLTIEDLAFFFLKLHHYLYHFLGKLEKSDYFR